MSNIAFLLWYTPLALATIVTLVINFVQYRHKRLTWNMTLQCLMLLGWLSCEIFYNLSTNEALCRFLYDFSLSFVAFFILSLFLFVIRFYNFESYYSPIVLSIFCVIPIITTLIAITSPHHEFLRQTFEFVSTTPRHQVIVTQGIWFWVHAAYCYILVITSVIICLVQYRKVPKIYQVPSRILIFGMSISLIANMLVIFRLFTSGPDLSLVGASIVSVTLLFSIRNNHGLDFFHQAKDEIFNELDEAIFVLDDKGAVINRNLSAKYMLYLAGINPDEPSYDLIQDRILAHAEKGAASDDLHGVNYILSAKAGGKVYNVKKRNIVNRRGSHLATIVIFSDVTKGYNAMSRLERETGMDPMTGLLNQRAVKLQVEELDLPKNLPLAVIVGNLNNLGGINKTLGHYRGDELIRITAEGLAACCPPNAKLARTGGDEFLILVPNYTRAQATALTQEIQQRLADEQDHGYNVSIALGADVKERPDQNLLQIIDSADSLMRENKHRYKTSGAK